MVNLSLELVLFLNFTKISDTIQGRSISPVIGLNNFIANYQQNIVVPSAGIFMTADDISLLFNFICQNGVVGDTRLIGGHSIQQFSQTAYNGTDFIFNYTDTSVSQNGLFKNAGSRYFFSNDPDAISHSGASGSIAGCSPNLSGAAPAGKYAAAYLTGIVHSFTDDKDLPPVTTRMLQAIQDTMAAYNAVGHCP